MHTCGTGFLGNSANRAFNFIACNHHQISKLINDNNNMRHWLKLRILFTKFIVTADISNPVFSESFISFFHFNNCPAKCTGSFTRIGYNRNEQMRNTVINRKLNRFRIDHYKFNFIRGSTVKNRHNHRI